MHLVSRADLHAVIPYGHPRIRTRKDPRLSLSPDSSAELKAAMPRPSEGAAAPSEPERNRHLFAFSPQQSLCGIEHICGLCLVKAKAPTVTGCGVSRGIVLSVGSGSPLSFGNMLCKTKLKREWKDYHTEAGRQGKHGRIADGSDGGTGALSACPFRPVLTCFCPPPLTFTVGSCQALFIVLY